MNGETGKDFADSWTPVAGRGAGEADINRTIFRSHIDFGKRRLIDERAAERERDMFALVLLFAIFSPAQAGEMPQTVRQVVEQAQKAFAAAKNEVEMQSIEMWCRDTVQFVALRERGQLITQAQYLSEVGKTEDAKKLAMQALTLPTLSRAVAPRLCRPASAD